MEADEEHKETKGLTNGKASRDNGQIEDQRLVCRPAEDPFCVVVCGVNLGDEKKKKIFHIIDDKYLRLNKELIKEFFTARDRISSSRPTEIFPDSVDTGVNITKTSSSLSPPPSSTPSSPTLDPSVLASFISDLDNPTFKLVYDMVYGQNIGQMYRHSCQPILDAVSMRGLNGSIIIQGHQQEFKRQVAIGELNGGKDGKNLGIIPSCIKRSLGLKQKSTAGNVPLKVSLSIIEITPDGNAVDLLTSPSASPSSAYSPRMSSAKDTLRRESSAVSSPGAQDVIQVDLTDLSVAFTHVARLNEIMTNKTDSHYVVTLSYLPNTPHQHSTSGSINVQGGSPAPLLPSNSNPSLVPIRNSTSMEVLKKSVETQSSELKKEITTCIDCKLYGGICPIHATKLKDQTSNSPDPSPRLLAQTSPTIPEIPQSVTNTLMSMPAHSTSGGGHRPRMSLATGGVGGDLETDYRTRLKIVVLSAERRRDNESLSDVIHAINMGYRVPYQKSPLTRLLKDCVGKRHRAVLVSCISSELKDAPYTFGDLKYAARCTAPSSTVRDDSSESESDSDNENDANDGKTALQLENERLKMELEIERQLSMKRYRDVQQLSTRVKALELQQRRLSSSPGGGGAGAGGGGGGGGASEVSETTDKLLDKIKEIEKWKDGMRMELDVFKSRNRELEEELLQSRSPPPHSDSGSWNMEVQPAENNGQRPSWSSDSIDIKLNKVAIKNGKEFHKPRFTLSIVGSNGLVLGHQMETPIASKTDANAIHFNTVIRVGVPMGFQKGGYNLFFEFKHFKKKVNKVSTRCFGFLKLRDISGDPKEEEGESTKKFTLPLYKKPTDYTLKKLKKGSGTLSIETVLIRKK